MADNVRAGSNDAGGSIFATDEVGGAHYPYTKVAFGADNTATPVTDSVGLPVEVLGTVPVSGTFWQATQPVSIASVPSHAVTNAGTFLVQAAQSGTWNVGTVTTLTGITNVVHVDDNGSTISIDDGGGSVTVDGSVSVSGVVPGTTATSLGKAEDAAAADGDTGVMMLAVRKDTAATTVGADGDYHPLEVDANGNLWVMAKLAASQTLAAVTSLSQFAGNAIATNSGNASAGTLRVVIATDQANLTTALNVQPGPSTSGGLSTYTFLSAGSAVQAGQIKGSAGQVYSLQFFNNSANLRYVRLYNMTGTPATTDTPVWRGLIPASTSGAGHIVTFPMGVAFGTGIGIRVTGAVADNDATNLNANEILGNIQYK